MIVLDTNVLSEPLRSRPDGIVAEWLDRHDPETLFLTSVTVAEALFGVELMPEGRRRDQLREATEAIIAVFGERVLDFDRSAATEYATRVASCRRTGIPVSVADGQIGAIAAAHGFAVATRDVEPFAALGLDVIDPWSAPNSQA